tara:strand:- start:5692 stop:6444 length:753 start_codon:yes stop_codon:yes gene_type:complete
MRNRPTAKLYAIAAILILIGIALPVSAAHSFSLLSAQSVGYTEPSEYLTEINSNRGRSNYGKNKKGRKGHGASKKTILDRLHQKKLYQRENFKKFIRDIRSSKASDRANFKYIKEGIIAHETGLRQGHTIEKHVGLSNKGLKDRHQKEKVEQGKKSNTFSTFKDLRSAERFIEKTIEAKMKTPEGRKEMRDFLRGPHNGEFKLSHTFSEITGRKYNGHTGEFSNVHGVKVTLLRNNKMPNGYQIVTAFPS